MKQPLVIKNYWALKAESSVAALEKLKQKIIQMETLPPVVTLVSAAELKPLTDSAVMDFYCWLKQI